MHSPPIFVCVSCARLVLNQSFLMTYTLLIFNCVWSPCGSGGALSEPLNQRFKALNSPLIFVCMAAWLRQISPQTRFITVYSPLIFVCVWRRLVLNQRFLMTYSPPIFICVTLWAKWLSRPLNQRFLMTYTPLTYCMRNCARSALNQRFLYRFIHHLSSYASFCTWNEQSIPLKQPFFNSARLTCFCMLVTQVSPQSTFFNDAYTAYFLYAQTAPSTVIITLWCSLAILLVSLWLFERSFCL